MVISVESASVPVFGGWPVEPASGRRGPRKRRRLGLVVSIVLHLALLVAASRVAWRHLEPLPVPRTDYVWIGEWRPQPVVVPPPVEVPTPAPSLEAESRPVEIRSAPQAPTTTPDLRSAQPRPFAPRATPRSEPVPRGSPSDAQDVPRVLVRDPDWDEERRRAVEAVAEEVARADEFREPTVEQLLKPRVREPYEIPERTIFDLGNRGGSSRGALSPGMARTKVGRALGELCNALTGGFGIFGMSVCARPRNLPTGLYPEVLPEWLKLMPICDQSKPVVAEAYPTARCRLVPKQTEEPLSAR